MKQALRFLRGDDEELERQVMAADLAADERLSKALRRKWWERFGEPARPCLLQSDRDREPNRKLRVGYLSGNFNFHSACSVFAHTVLGHSADFEAYCYSSAPPAHHDSVTEFFQRETRWRDVFTWTDTELTKLIREEAIDILVDLSGFTPWNRLPVFAMRPAPVQVHGWGYALPTRFPCFDAFLADPVALPESDRTDMERVVDLPCVLSHLDRTIFPDVSPLPCLAAPPVFGSFNRPTKIDERALALWRRILDRVPGSRLRLKFGGWSKKAQAMVRNHLGVRVEFPGPSPLIEFVGAYRDVDLTLDPVAHSGGVSTLESLWMGVPAVTLPGRHMGTRLSASAQTVLGLTDFIAVDEDDYVERAVAWVTTRSGELGAVRAGLRERMRESRLCRGYVPAVEAAYRMLWKEWCAL